MNAFDLTAIRQAYESLAEDVEIGISPLGGIDMLRRALDDLAALELEAARQAALAAIAAAVGNATTHEWTVYLRVARCSSCQTMSSRLPLTTGAVPVCAPGQGCTHAISPMVGGASRCSTCRETFEPSGELSGVSR